MKKILLTCCVLLSILQLAGCGSEETKTLLSSPQPQPSPFREVKARLSSYQPINRLSLTNPASQLDAKDIRMAGESMACNSYAQYSLKGYYVPFEDSSLSFSDESEDKVLLAKLCDIADDCPSYLLQRPTEGQELYFATCKSNFFHVKIDGINIHDVQFIKTFEKKWSRDFISFIFLADNIYRFDSVNFMQRKLRKMRPISAVSFAYSDVSNFDVIVKNCIDCKVFSANKIFELSDSGYTAFMVIKNCSSNIDKIVNIWEVESTLNTIVKEDCINKTLNPNESCILGQKRVGSSYSDDNEILIEYITQQQK